MANKKCCFSFVLILLIFNIILSIVLCIYTIFLYIFFKKRLKKREENDVQDINIKCFKTFNFIDDSIRPTYDPMGEDLGLAGRLFLKCHTGTCIKEKIYKEYFSDCDDEDCYIDYIYKVKIYTLIYYNCSLYCFYTKGSNCDSCPNDYNDQGVCTLNDDDIYDPEKICFGDNLIYFWKGKKFQIEKLDALKNKTYTYMNDVKLKDEQCPENTKNCGILDDEGNKLCLPTNAECPPNVISTTKLNINNYRTTIIDNKTFYYAFDENAINNKIIAGLYVDSDIYINKEEESENSIILDTYTISGLLKDNYMLYRGVYLGYDPYEIHNIDEKGKSV